MNVAVKWGLILGVAVALMGFVFGGTGLHTNPPMAMVFVGLAVVINIVVVVLALKQAAGDTAWSGQLVNGLIVGVIGAAIIFAGSYLMTGVIFPDYYQEMREGYREFAENAGLEQAEIDAQMEALEAATPVNGAMQGAVGTVITSVVVAAIGGIFLRRK